MNTKKMKKVRNMVIIISVVLGFICWLFIPYEFKNSLFFHSGTGMYGTKTVALILLLFPLFALIPDKENNEVHTDDMIEREKLVEEFSLREAKRQTLIATYIGITIIAVLGIAALIL